MSRRSPSPTPSHSPVLNSATHSSSTTTSTASSSLHSPFSAASPMSDEDDAIPPHNSTSPPPTTTGNSLLPCPTSTRTPSFPIREDCWSEAATHTLIEAWGSHYIELNRGNLRQKQWQEVADAVNSVHAHTKKLHRTDIQCKNRIDTLKKKYKVEKAKFIESDGHYVSPWPFFSSLDSLIGDSFLKSNPPHSPSPSYTRKGFTSSNTAPAPVRKDFLALPPPPSVVPVGPRSKRPAHVMVHLEDVGFRRKFSSTGAVAAIARRGEEEEEEEDEESETSSGAANGIRRRKRRPLVENEVGVKGYGQLAEAIGKFGEIYERVEEAKQRQMIELEKQRMQFAKDLEIQRMKLFMESQLQLEKIKRSKHRSRADTKELDSLPMILNFLDKMDTVNDLIERVCGVLADVGTV